MFLNPFLLFGLTAISVPIIIHLLNRRRFDRVVWAAMRFVQQAVEQNQRRIRVEDLILLILRCLIIALIVLALSRCALQSVSAPFAGGSVSAVIVIDNSYSMSQKDGQTTRFEQAKQLADRVVENLPQSAAISVMLASDVVDPLIAEPTVDRDAIRRAIGAAAISDRGTNMVPPLKKAIGTLSGRPALKKEIYIVTDSQGLGWRQTGDIQKLLEENKREISATFIFAGDMPTRNVGVSGLRMTTDIAAVNRPLRFEVQVTNYGRTAVSDVPVKLSVDSDTVADSITTGEIPAGASKSVSLSAKFRGEGYHAVTARITGDEIPADDSRSIVVRAIKTVQVLLVDGEPGREPRDSKTFFLRPALQPVPLAQREGFYIQYRNIAAAELPGQRLDDFDAVILANVAEISPGELPAIERFVRNGGGLVVFPGANANTVFYNEQLFRKRGLLPMALGEARGDASQGARFWTFQTKDYEHPIAAYWNAPDIGNLAGAHFYRVFDLQPAGPNMRVEAAKDVQLGTPRVVLRYNDGKPAIAERTWGLGRVVMFSSGADTSWNDLPVRPQSFIPLLHRVVGSLVTRQDDFINVRVGESLTLDEPSDFIGRDVIVRPPGDEKSPPTSTRIELVDGVAKLKFDRTSRAGVYHVAIGSNPADAIKFAAVRNAEESSIDSISPSQLKELGAAAGVVQWRPGVQIDDQIKKARTGTELWFPLALAALVLAAAETFLAHLFSRPK